MKEKISISDIVLDESIYPRERIDRKRVSLFAENMRDGFNFDPIVVEHHPEKKGKYRILDGVHRWNACREVGYSDMPAVIKDLNGTDPLLYAAGMAIGPRQLTDEESKNTARRAFQNNPATDEDPKNAILLTDYCKISAKAGWELTHIIQSPMSSERFDAVVVSAMQKKRILGVTSRYVIISKISK